MEYTISMKRLRKLVGLFLVLFVTYNQSKAQSPKEFPRDSIEFFDVMNDYLSDARKEGKDFMKQFEVVWYGGYFSEKQREGVYDVSNRMLKKNYRPFPDFRNFLFTVGSFVTDENQSDESFTAWQNTLFKLLDDRRKKNFTSFLNFCNDLFRENALYYSPSNVWASNNGDYKFDFDSLPKVTFDSLDLICYSRGDSMKIIDTRGTYYPTENKWLGQGGTVNWLQAGLEEEKVFATFSDYQIDTKKNDYIVDSVKFHNSYYLDKPLLGRMENKVLANMTPERTSYPRFDSYDKRIRIENLFPGVNFDGGFSMRGAKLLGTGDETQDAFVEFYRNDTLFLKALSENISIRTDRVVSTEAAIRIYFGKDSVYHPGLDFKFLNDQRLVTLYREGSGVSGTPYTNTFHNIEMDFEVLNWKMDEPILELTNLIGGTKKDAYFTSIDFFKEEIFAKIGGLDQNNPLYQIKRMVDNYNQRVLPVSELAGYLNLEVPYTKNLIVEFTSMGFLSFDFDQGTFTVKQKLIDFVLSMQRRIDYDVLSIYSNIEGAPNGKINLLNYDLTINGIPGIVVSDSQQVVLIPQNGQIKMKKNRFFDFAGQVKAGRFDFYGKEFDFDYKNFKIGLVNVDSMQIKAPTGKKDERGFPILKPVKTVVQDLNGELLIDNFGNKSGLKDFPEYPILTSKKESYVYYDKKEVLGGVYDRNRFYFQLEPFTIDSLDNFNNDQLKFKGSFNSADIFPEFEEQLTLQEDFSLGFKRSTPPGGYPTYKGKGQFYDNIQLSHEGLRGDGKLEYITSTTYSKDFIFYPDSMRTKAEQYFVDAQEAGPEYPEAKAEATKMRWLPYNDVMYASTTSSGMQMYDPKTNFEGTSAYRPSGMEGNGIYHFERADLGSNLMKFGYQTFDADTANFQLSDEASGSFALKTDNVNAHVDFEGRFAQFKSNGEADPIEFPVNQYLCYMEEFKWFMDDGSIELSSSKSTQVSADVRLEGSKFISTHHEQDSLFFYSPVAKYNSRKYIIEAKEVVYINAADARVYPDSGNVTILKKAEMKPLLNSRIVANSVTEYHNIYNANTNIFGRKNYSASGYIDYVDRNENVQTVYLQSITVDTTGQTTGEGRVSDSAHFTLSPQFAFRGKVKLFGNKQFLVFDGLTQISHNCQRLDRPWIDFEAEIDPNEIYIPIDTTMRTPSGAFVASSMNLNTDSNYFYSGFLTERRNYSDINVLPAYGFLHYDLNDKQYKISSKEKIQELSLPGNYLSLHTENCKVYGEGAVDIGARSGNVKFEAAGNINHNLIDNSIVLDLIMTIDFYFDDNLFKMLAEDINESINLQPIDFTRETYEKGLRELIGVEKADEMISQLSLNGKIKRLPDELNKRLVFNDVKFKWNEEMNAYKSFGKLGITNINKEEVYKYVEGAIMITKSRGGDMVDILLELEEGNWYYFTYRRNLLKAISTNEEFNLKIKEMKRDDRKYKNAKGEAPFTYMFGSEREKERFLSDFESEF